MMWPTPTTLLTKCSSRLQGQCYTVYMRYVHLLKLLLRPTTYHRIETRIETRIIALALAGPLLFLLGACGPVANQPPAQQQVSIGAAFQGQATPMATVPDYRCGAWASNNAPSAYGNIVIYAKLTHDLSGIMGAMANAVVHFKDQDVTLDQQSISDDGGYVTFSLALQGRQARGIPATVDVSFNIEGKTIACSPAFFTPQ